MKLSTYAKQNSITYKTAWTHFKNNLINGAYQLPTGTVVVPENQSNIKKEEYVVVYARVSSNSKNDKNVNMLDNQSKRLCDFCTAKGWIINEIVKETASGLNDNRPKLLKILQEQKATKIIVEHKDRLTRFGFNYIKMLYPGEIIIINEVENDKEDIIQDFISIITSFCARIYGNRRSKRKTEKIIKQLNDN